MTSTARLGHPRKFPALLILLPLGAGLILAGSTGCRLYKMERKLSPPYAEFLSKVGYIMTREERKIFLELPDDRKDGFIE